LWDGQSAPLLVPFSEYESVFQTTAPAGDGQYKAQVYPQENGTELYIAKAGRFNVESNLGWEALVALVDSSRLRQIPELSHAQIQTLLGGIGASKDHDIWIPPNDRGSLDWTLTPRFEVRDSLPQGFEKAENVLQEIDVIWTRRGSNEIGALFEVEHSTSVYSGLLRFNDIHLISPNARPRFSIVANENRRDVFVRQVNRPTFQASGLTALCNFLDYRDVFLWHTRSIESTTEIGGTA
jgi:hypothetical protein